MAANIGRWIGASILVAISFFGNSTAMAQPALKRKLLPDAEELKVMRALPAVYRIRTFGKNVIDFPLEVRIDVSPLLAAYDRDLVAGKVPEGMLKADYLWSKASEDFKKYITASATDRGRAETRVGGHGTGFVVSREGILLTNAHVVEAPHEQPFDVEMVLQNNQALGGAPAKLVEEIASRLGKPSEDFAPTVVSRLLLWYGDQCRLSGEANDVYVEMPLDPREPNTVNFDSGVPAFSALLTERQPIHFAATVLAKGKRFENSGAMDIAILSVPDAKDILVTVPLAERDEVVKEMPATSLGFPGMLDGFRKLQNENFIVHVVPGRVLSVPQPPVKGFERLQGFTARERLANSLIEFTCHITAGMSGGPVLSENGKVIGLNVSGYDHLAMLFPHRLGESKYAVPIWNAKQMLDELGIKPEASSLTATWEEGLKLFRAGKYSDAESKFQEVASKQFVLASTVAVDEKGNPLSNGGDNSSKKRFTVTHRYVEQMIKLCEQRQKAR